MNNNDGKMMSFVIDHETKRRLEEMAIAQGRSLSNLIRWLINQEWEKIKAGVGNEQQPQ